MVGVGVKMINLSRSLTLVKGGPVKYEEVVKIV